MSERPAEGQKRIPADELEARGLVTHEYHLHMLKAVVAEREEARDALATAQERIEKLEAALRSIGSNTVQPSDFQDALSLIRAMKKITHAAFDTERHDG